MAPIPIRLAALKLPFQAVGQLQNLVLERLPFLFESGSLEFGQRLLIDALRLVLDGNAAILDGQLAEKAGRTQGGVTDGRQNSIFALGQRGFGFGDCRCSII